MIRVKKNDAQIRANKLSTLTGTAGEMAVAADLLYKGYHVFKSLSGAAPFDLIAYDEMDGECLRIECREPLVEYPNSDRLYWSSSIHRGYTPDLFAVACKRRIRYFDNLRREVEIENREVEF